MPKYKEEQESRYISRTVAILSELPEFCTVFYDKNQTTFLPKTQYDYMRAMRSFLTYQQQSHPYFNDRELADYTLDDLEHLTVKDANNFYRMATANNVCFICKIPHFLYFIHFYLFCAKWAINRKSVSFCKSTRSRHRC